MEQRKLLTLCFGLLLCSCSQNDNNESDIILIDASKKYPKLELRLSDIAEIAYIPLKSDDVILGYPSVTRALFVYRDKIVLGDKISTDPKLLVYDRTGTHIQTIGSYGRGPGEYMGIRDFVVDTLSNEIILYDNVQRMLIVYGLDGKFRRNKSLNQIDSGQTMLTGIENMNDSTLLVFNNASLIFSERRGGVEFSTGKTMMILDKQTLSAIPSQSFGFARPSYSDRPTILPYLTTTKEGVYITSERSDTIFFMNKNLEVIPKFRDVTADYKNGYKVRIFPTMETERYVFFVTVEVEKRLDVINSNPFLISFFAYDKKMQQLFSLNDDLSEQIGKYDRVRLVINNKSSLSEFNLTLNHDYASALLSPEFLFEHDDQLPMELKEITKNLQEGDEPVLMLIKFK